MLTVTGYSLALLIGVSLGLIGSGGSVLTVPVLVYVIGVSPILATGYSLFIVGATALVGAMLNARKRLVNFKVAFIFGLPSFVAVYAVRRYIMPLVPTELFSLSGGLVITKDMGLMLLFAALMFAASFSMLRGTGKKNKHETTADTTTAEANEPHFTAAAYSLIVVEGLMVGAVTGAVGAGGGFLIIPALVLLAKLPMKTAVGTSLLIIAMKSLVGFAGELSVAPVPDVTLLAGFTALAVVGIGIGSLLSRRFSSERLKILFGWFLIAMSLYIPAKELFLR